ncbi:MAG: magnesium transporter [Deltaproteobacteria bacterium]
MQDPLLIPELREYITDNKTETLKAFFEKTTPAVAAEYLAAFDPAEVWHVIRTLKPAIGAEIFTFLDQDVQVEIAAAIKRQEIARLLGEMSSDDRVDLLKRIPEERREAIMPAIAMAEREDIRRLSAYREGSAGAVMTSDYATLTSDLTVAQAIERLRKEAPDKETIYYAYVLDKERHLIGFLSLKDLILAHSNARIGNIMHRDVIHSQVDDDQEEAARKIQKYDLIALPVVNDAGALVGIITHDDAIDIITQEHTEDMEKLMAIAGSHEARVYLRTSSWIHFKNRAFWIVGLAALEIVSGFIIHSYENTLMSLMILALYMPMIADTGGNTGRQSATVVIRAMALGEIAPKDAARVLFKELKIALLLSLVLGVLSWGKVMFLSHGTSIPAGFSLFNIGIAISVALSIQVVTATLVGAMLPLGAALMKWDPAVVASPALTTIVDITGLLIYFSTAKLMLGI